MQTTSNILLVRPASFGFNHQTSESNAFQHSINESHAAIQQKVNEEFNGFVATLQAKGLNVIVADDTKNPIKPDAIFPNNWTSFHADGTVVLYPMFAPNRRLERRLDIIETLKKQFKVTAIIDLAVYESDYKFLEGTGSIVFDHDNKIAYACLSPRTHQELLLQLCHYINYTPHYFFAYDENGKEIYHTNVMMCIGEKFAVICLQSITSINERHAVLTSLTKTGHEIIDISLEQMNHFAGNMLALQSGTGERLLALSQSAYDSLTLQQKEQLAKYCEFIPLPITTIETIGGGSARCMIAELFLPRYM